jgi:hypothetical protein
MKKVLKKAEDDSPFHEAPTEPHTVRYQIQYLARHRNWRNGIGIDSAISITLDPFFGE